MSKDIRSYFQVGAKKSSLAATRKPPESPIVKRKAIQILSEDDEIPDTPKEKTKKQKTLHKKRRIVDSDEEESDTSKKSQKPNLSKLKAKEEKPEPVKKIVNVSELFKVEPQRIERKKLKPEDAADDLDVVMKSDDEFEMSVLDLDESVLVAKSAADVKTNGKSPRKDPGKEEARSSKQVSEKDHKSPKPSPKKEKVSTQKDGQLHEPVSSRDGQSQEHASSQDNVPSRKRVEKITPAKPHKHEIISDDEHKNASKTPKQDKRHDLDSSVLSDEERHERKRLTAILYQKYKNRQSVINPGSKEIPKGKPNCLAGLTFLVTGILESLEREECQNLIKELGGKISSTVGKRLNYMVVGEEAGPKKLVTAEELGIKQISEDELFNLIREKSNVSTDSKPNVTKKLPKTEPKPKESIKKEITPTKRKHITETIEDEPQTKKVKQEIVASPKKEKATTKSEEPKTSSVDVSKEGIEAWVDKYKPTCVKQIIGQQGPASNCNKLINWLSKWYVNHDGKKKLQKPNPWAKNDDGSYYRAALLSGPPGIGKTTTANLVSKELGFDIVEFNASDTRSKRLLKEEVSELLSNKSLYGYFHGDNKTVSKKHVLIMDEVDGMAGNEDRGGIQELISLIKDSSIPIICMCNDRNHPKMRSLVNYCYDLRFSRPRMEQIKGAVMSICFKEKIKLPPAKIEEIITATNQDIRQTLNHLSLLSAGKDLKLEGKSNNTARKDLKLGPWEVVRKVLSFEEHKKMTLNDKSDLFFNDYSLAPLFVQQNYLITAPNVPKNQVIQQVALAADALSLGDLVDKKIRSNSAWSLLPTQAMFSSVLPGEYMAGRLTGQINFPAWLGKNSKSGKRSRLAQEIHDHTRIRTSGSRLSVRLDYAPFLLDAIIRPLQRGSDGLEEALNVIKEYRLLREDIDALIELTSWPGKKNPMDSVDSKVKAALTRAYNKEVLAYSYSATAGVKKKKAESEIEAELLGEEDAQAVAVVSDEEEDDNVENDALIKPKKKPSAKASSDASTSKASTSKRGGASAKGRGGRQKK